MKQNQYIWDEETKTSTVIVYDHFNNAYTGTAICHPDDYDMVTQRTGMAIAEKRACLKLFQNELRYIKSELRALEQLYYSMSKSKHFNAESYENKMLQRQIFQKKEDIETYKGLIATMRTEIYLYIMEKDSMYKTIRNLRREKQLEEEHS